MADAPRRRAYNMRRFYTPAGEELPRESPALPIWLHGHLARQLIEEAERRFLSPGELARKILTTIVRDNLFDAVLDD